MKKHLDDEVYRLIKGLGFDPLSPNFAETSTRVERMWNAFRNQQPPIMTTFPKKVEGGMLVMKNHQTWGFCPHHLLPVKYTFKIGYIPNKLVLGLSKLARVADWILKDMPLQEDIAGLVLAVITPLIKPKGAGCIVHGEHLCMRMRGVASPCAEAVSDEFYGVMLTEDSAREEFLSL